MSFMFNEAINFNQDISISTYFKNNNTYNSWNVSQVTDMTQMFSNARSFNQDISNWNVSSVKNMYGMFMGAEMFSQNLSGWDVETIINAPIFFSEFLKKDYFPKWGQKPITIPIQEPIITQIYDLSQLTKFQNIISSIDIFQKIIYMIKNNYLNKDFKTQSRNDPTNIQTTNYKSFINNCNSVGDINNCSGGIIGYIFNGSINNCIVNGNLIGDHSGGIVSQACTLPINYYIPYTIPLLVNITNCSVNGKVKNTNTSGYILGDNSGNSSNNKFCEEIIYDSNLDNSKNIFLFVKTDNRK